MMEETELKMILSDSLRRCGYFVEPEVSIDQYNIPDFRVTDLAALSKYFYVECKGSKFSRRALLEQIGRYDSKTPQKIYVAVPLNVVDRILSTIKYFRPNIGVIGVSRNFPFSHHVMYEPYPVQTCLPFCLASHRRNRVIPKINLELEPYKSIYEAIKKQKKPMSARQIDRMVKTDFLTPISTLLFFMYRRGYLKRRKRYFPSRRISVFVYWIDKP